MNRPLLTLKPKIAAPVKKPRPRRQLLPVNFKRAVSHEVLAKLVAAHPSAFFPKGSADTLPLAVGIKADLIAAHPEIKPYFIGIFLGNYTGKNRYLRAVMERGSRVNLDGEPVQPIHDEHREHARALLAIREAELTQRKGQIDAAFGRSPAAPPAV